MNFLLKELVGSWFARETALAKVQARPNDPSAERILQAPCQRFLQQRMRVCIAVTCFSKQLTVSIECLGFYCHFILYFSPSLSLPLLLSIVGWTEALPDTPVEEAPPGPEVPEKIKKRYRKKKTKLEEAFPTYLQVDFYCCLQ